MIVELGLKRFKVLRLNSKSSTLHVGSARPMDNKDYDLEAFESNLSVIIRNRELGQNALVFLRQNASYPQVVGEGNDDDARQEAASHIQSDSD